MVAQHLLGKTVRSDTADITLSMKCLEEAKHYSIIAEQVSHDGWALAYYAATVQGVSFVAVSWNASKALQYAFVLWLSSICNVQGRH